MKWWIDDVAGPGVSREGARILIYAAMDSWWDEPAADPRVPDRATWGLLPEQVEGQERALRLIPGGM